MTTKELAEVLNVTKDTVLNTANEVLPNKQIAPGKPTHFDENEVALLTYAIQRKAGNNHIHVNTEAHTDKEVLLSIVNLLNIHSCFKSTVNIQSINEYVSAVPSADCHTILKSLADVFAAKRCQSAFRSAFKFADTLDTYRYRNSVKHYIEEKSETDIGDDI